MQLLSSSCPHSLHKFILSLSNTLHLPCCACISYYLATCISVGVLRAGHARDSAGCHRLRAVEDDTARQQALAEAGGLDLPFESDIKTFSGGSTASTAAAGNWLGPSECRLRLTSSRTDNAAWSGLAFTLHLPVGAGYPHSSTPTHCVYCAPAMQC